MTSQVKLKLDVWLFGIGDMVKQNFDVKHQQSQWISMDSVSIIF